MDRPIQDSLSQFEYRREQEHCLKSTPKVRVLNAFLLDAQPAYLMSGNQELEYSYNTSMMYAGDSSFAQS